MYIDIHTHNKSHLLNIKAIYNKGLTEEIADNSYFSLGIHPWFIKQKNLPEYYLILKNDLSKNNCLALGECGLDKICKTDFNLQKEVFLKQLEINQRFKKPVIIHGVKAYQELIKIKKDFDYTFIFHGFNKKQQVAEMLLQNDFYLSFGKDLLQKEAVQQAFKNAPLNRVFFETDNDSVSIEKIYKKASQLKQIPLKDVILAIEKNFKTVFT